MSKLSEEEAVALLKETFKEHEAEAESLPLARKSRTPRRAAAALLAAASVAAVVAGGLYVANQGGEQVAVTPPASTPPPGQISPPPRVRPAPSVYSQAYAEVIKALLVDTPKPGKLVILNAPYAGLFPGDSVSEKRGVPFSESTQFHIAEQIRALGPVSWVTEKPVQKDICNPQPKGIVVVTLGEVVRKDGHLEIVANSWQSCLAAEWITFRLDMGATGWQVSGTVGPQVIS
ncbi:hypothetical protein OG394_23620 [Kribbella sp. NBC_01245]|uniref:hypothetical protein n=1 Tax=Kribbella sp. NBC_01245 TaxID=2903578 RepID=UPI002E292731|nr:hypothetical protein [Kribbella sp. NBC_01245]